MQPERHDYGDVPPSLLRALSLLATVSRRISRTLRSAGRHALEHLGYFATSLVTWSNAGRRALRLLAEERRLQHQRTRAIQALGEAAYRDDLATAASAKQQVASLEERLFEATRIRRETLDSASRRVGAERLATQSTESHHVDELSL